MQSIPLYKAIDFFKAARKNKLRLEFNRGAFQMYQGRDFYETFVDLETAKKVFCRPVPDERMDEFKNIINKGVFPDSLSKEDLLLCYHLCPLDPDTLQWCKNRGKMCVNIDQAIEVFTYWHQNEYIYCMNYYNFEKSIKDIYHLDNF